MIFLKIFGFMADLVTGHIFRPIPVIPVCFSTPEPRFTQIISAYFQEPMPAVISPMTSRFWEKPEVWWIKRSNWASSGVGKKTVINPFGWPRFVTRVMTFMASFIKCQIIIWGLASFLIREYKKHN